MICLNLAQCFFILAVGMSSISALFAVLEYLEEHHQPRKVGGITRMHKEEE